MLIVEDACNVKSIAIIFICSFFAFAYNAKIFAIACVFFCFLSVIEPTVESFFQCFSSTYVSGARDQYRNY